MNTKNLNGRHQRFHFRGIQYGDKGNRRSKASRHLLKWLQLIVQPGDVTEVFVKELIQDGFDLRQNYVGFYDSDHLAELAMDAVECSGKCTAVYYRMNPVASALQARSSNQLKLTRYAQSGTSEDITRRRLLMIDVDPVRPGGISANTAERSAAKAVADEIASVLKAEEWPEPAFIDTGNGYSLFFGLDLPTDNDELVRKVLQGLDSRFGNDNARVDLTVHDPARLARLPGTKNCKGDEVADRLHRHCKVLHWPSENLTPVDRQLLDAVAISESVTPAGDQHLGKPEDAILSAARSYISKMPGAVSGQNGHGETFGVACRLVIGFDLSPDNALPLMREYNARCKPPWSDVELRKKLEDADVLDEPRGALRITSNASGSTFEAMPLAGAQFFGYVPDFADAARMDVLDGFEEYELGLQNPVWWPRYFLTWQLQRTDIALPTIWLRQFRWGGRWPRNWKTVLLKSLNIPNSKRQPPLCESTPEQCPIHGTPVRHSHFVFTAANKWGLLDQFAGKAADDGHLHFRLHSDDAKDKKQELRRKGLLVRAYWPGLLFGTSPRIDWSVGQQRLLQGIVYELTRPHGQKHGQHKVTEGRVVTAGKGRHSVLCPVLDAHREYVVFGGNGRRHGRGYQIVGRTSKGWLRRAGFPEAPPRGSSIRVEAITMLLENLAALADDLELVVVGYHPRRKEWKGLEELQDCLRTGNGHDWLEECTVRIFAPHDWQLRWRYFFSRRMGFRWIPASVDDDGPFEQVSDVSETSASLTPQDVKKWLRSKGWTQSQLADLLGCSRRRISRHLTGARWTAKFVTEVSSLMHRQNGTPSSPRDQC